MTSTDKLIKKYLKETKKNCPYALRKHLDAELKTSLIDFCESQDDPTMGTIEKRFGNPKQYAAEYISLCEANDIDKRINTTYCHAGSYYCYDIDSSICCSMEQEKSPDLCLYGRY